MWKCWLGVGWAALLLLLMSGVARAEGPTYFGPWTRAQWDAVGLIYEYAEFEGLTQADTELALRIAFRETVYGYNKAGDCYSVAGGVHCSGIGVFQFHEYGVWASTPCARLGLNARWNDDDNVRCAVWAIKNGYASHWRPWECPPGRWPAVVPADPRGWLWGQQHYPWRYDPQMEVVTDD